MQNSTKGSFKFQRNTSGNSSGSSTRSNGQEQCRKRLKDKFDDCEKSKGDSIKEDESKQIGGRSVLSVLNLSDTRKYIRNGTERLSKTLNSVRVSFGTLSQRFKTATRRREILQEGPMTPNAQTPYTRARQVLGRTPTKLYSPFGIDSPYNSTTVDKENVPVSKSLVKQ